ncbi:hypothetical protein J6590_085289 [Homalodisca vitripennis]|nr:hypothetical protein J6590_085289 [Homalodisca vitripennis]
MVLSLHRIQVESTNTRHNNADHCGTLTIKTNPAIPVASRRDTKRQNAMFGRGRVKVAASAGKHGNLKLKHGSSDTSFERAHLVELNSANRISKGLSNQKWRVVLGTHCEVHYALPFLTGSSYSDAVGGVSLY